MQSRCAVKQRTLQSRGMRLLLAVEQFGQQYLSGLCFRRHCLWGVLLVVLRWRCLWRLVDGHKDLLGLMHIVLLLLCEDGRRWRLREYRV